MIQNTNVKKYQFKTHYKGDCHISKTANIIFPGLMIKQRWTPLRLQAKWCSNSLNCIILVETTSVFTIGPCPLPFWVWRCCTPSMIAVGGRPSAAVDDLSLYHHKLKLNLEQRRPAAAGDDASHPRTVSDMLVLPTVCLRRHHRCTKVPCELTHSRTSSVT